MYLLPWRTSFHLSWLSENEHVHFSVFLYLVCSRYVNTYASTLHVQQAPTLNLLQRLLQTSFFSLTCFPWPCSPSPPARRSACPGSPRSGSCLLLRVLLPLCVNVLYLPCRPPPSQRGRRSRGWWSRAAFEARSGTAAAEAKKWQ